MTVQLARRPIGKLTAPSVASSRVFGDTLAAARAFAREKFGVRHRYAMALHTDQTNPHVHLVVKAEDETGRRLHVDKPVLREWRADFARMGGQTRDRLLRHGNPCKAEGLAMQQGILLAPYVILPVDSQRR